MRSRPELFTTVRTEGGLLPPDILQRIITGEPDPGGRTPTAYGLVEGERLNEAINRSWTRLRTAWEAFQRRLAELPETDLATGPTRQQWLLVLLDELHFGRLSPAQPVQIDGEDYPVSHGWGAVPIHLVGCRLDLDRRTPGAAGAARTSPFGLVQQLLNRSDNHLWGIVSNGFRLRLLRDNSRFLTASYVEFDLAAMMDGEVYADFALLWLLCHASRFEGARPEECWLERWARLAEREGVRALDHLRDGVERALVRLGNGFLQHRANAGLRQRLASGDLAPTELYRQLLRLVYRLLFLFVAEDRELLFDPGAEFEARDRYERFYSTARLRRLASRVRGAGHGDLWQLLRLVMGLLSGERGGAALGLPVLDGRLWSGSALPDLEAAELRNEDLLAAIRALAFTRTNRRLRPVDYRNLGTEELGSVYESLLDLAPVVQAGPPPTFAFVAGTERKDLGAYYTPSELVDFVLKISLDRLIAERLRAAGSDRSARAEALLSLTICDPACGSGHFLLGAARRLGKALAQVRNLDDEPGPEAVREATREIIGRCLYGVDKNELAVELCRVALWIEATVPGLPLSFLDHHLQHGDSLVGWPLLAAPGEIPDDAYTAPSGADGRLKRFLAEARRQNALARAGQRTTDRAPASPRVQVEYPDLTAPERTPADVAHHAEDYQHFLDSEPYQRLTTAADLWTAAFFWNPEVGVPAPTTADYWRALAGDADPDQAAAAARLLAEFPAFHWALRFADILRRGGFDAILGNPPWEQVKLSEREWFGPRRPDIAALTDGRARAIAGLATEDPALFAHWQQAQAAYARLAEHFRACGRFTPSGTEANTYLLFAELAANHLGSAGRAGVVVKSALGLDLSAAEVFRRLLDEGRIEEFHDFVNGGGTVGTPIFTAVNEHVRFAVVALGHREPDRPFACTMLNFTIEEGLNRPRLLVTRDALRHVNPVTRTLISYRRDAEFEIALGLHRHFVTLDFDGDGANPWGLSYHTLFHSSGARKKGFFERREDLEADGWILGPDRIFRRRSAVPAAWAQRQGRLPGLDALDPQPELPLDDEQLALPLYEGQLANRYDHRARTYEGYTGDTKYGRKPAAPVPSDRRKGDPSFETEPRYWMLCQVAEDRLHETVGGKAMLGFRDVAVSFADARCAKAALLPRYPATDTLPILAVPHDRALEFIGLFNSSPFDFLVRGHMPGAHVKSVWMLSQIASPAPGLDPQIADNARKLSLTSHSVADQFGVEPYPWDPEERYRLDVETDALVAHAYGLTAEQYGIVLDSFEVLARIEVREHGRFRLKEDCLRAYGEVG